jgi:mannosyltransferase OCH1-like enzyme
MAHNPSFDYVLFDDNDNKMFIAEHFPWFLDRFMKYDKPIKKADAIRYFYLYLHGGIYADLDFECLKPFDGLLDRYSGTGVLLGCMKDADDMATTSANNIPNAIMISRPREDFWICMFHVLLTRGHGTGDYSTENETGPIALKDAYLIYSKTDYKATAWYNKIHQKLRASGLEPCADTGVRVLPAKILYPISWEQPEMKAINNEMLKAKDRAAASQKAKRIFPDSYAATYWTHSWGDQ